MKVFALGDLWSGDQSVRKAAVQSLRQIERAARANGIGLLIDAEHAHRQDQARKAVLKLCSKDSRVYNTYQLYLKDTEEKLNQDLAWASSNGNHLGFKLVRGAYLTSEPREIIHDCKADTDEAYNRGVRCVLKRLDSSNISLLVATHNFESVQLAISQMDALGLARNDPRISFAQILGLGEKTTKFVADHGCNVANLVVFGEQQQLTPWLLRRLEEMRSMESI